ncbi:MAG: cache domain-containing protein [Bacteroidales bacterium]|nr:cache domain-containing protein [Bacteroidales bacterium]
MSRHISIVRTVLTYNIIVTIALVAAIIFVFADFESSNLKYQAKQLNAELMRKKRETIHFETEHLIQIIDYQIKNDYELLKRSIIQSVGNAHEAALSIYKQYKGKIPDEILKQIVFRIIKDHRILDFDTPVFVRSNNNGIIFTINDLGKVPDVNDINYLEKRNLLDEWNFAFNNGSGFYRDDLIPISSSGFQSSNNSLTYLKYFEPYQWVIGIRLTEEAVYNAIKNQLNASIIENVRLKSFQLVVISEDDLVVYSDQSIFEKNKPANMFTDAYGQNIYAEILNQLASNQSGLIEYYTRQEIDNQVLPLLFYFKKASNIKWIVGYSVSISELLPEIEKSKEELKQNLLGIIYRISLILFIAIIAILLSGLWFSRNIRKNLSVFATQFQNAVDKRDLIDYSRFTFREMHSMIHTVNRILEMNRQSQEDLYESEQKYRLIAENVSDVIWNLNIDGSIRYVSPSIYNMLGIHPEDILGLTPFRYLSEGSQRKLRFLLDKLSVYNGRSLPLTKPVNVFLEVTYGVSDTQFLDGSVSIVYDKTGAFMHILAITRNVTEGVKSRKAMLEIQDKIQIISANLRDVIWTMDFDLKTTYISPSVELLEGYTVTERLALSLEDILKYEDYIAIKNDFLETNNAIKQGLLDPKLVKRSYEIEIRKKDGSWFWAEILVGLILNESNSIVAIHGATRDVTKRHMAQKSLEESERELRALNITKDKFFSILAHDLRSPFNSLLGFLSLLTERYDEFTDVERLTFLEQLKTSSENTYLLLDNLLTWAKTQTGHISCNPEKLILRDIVDSVISSINVQAVAKEISINSAIRSKNVVFADTDMLQTVLRNLISNAIKFTHRRGNIEISAKQQKGSFVEVSVKDSGIGIPPEDIDKLFAINEKIRHDGTEAEKGSGLGLLLCFEFVERNGGTITVDSIPGQGSTFKFTIPVG